MRHMMPTFYKVTHKVDLLPLSVRNVTLVILTPSLCPTLQLQEAIEQRVRNGPTEVNMVMWMGRTALELVGQAGLGYSFDKLTEETADELGDALKSLVSVPTPSSSSYHKSPADAC